MFLLDLAFVLVEAVHRTIAAGVDPGRGHDRVHRRGAAELRVPDDGEVFVFIDGGFVEFFGVRSRAFSVMVGGTLALDALPHAIMKRLDVGFFHDDYCASFQREEYRSWNVIGWLLDRRSTSRFSEAEDVQWKNTLNTNSERRPELTSSASWYCEVPNLSPASHATSVNLRGLDSLQRACDE